MANPLITLTEPQSATAEAFRALRTNLIFSGIDRPLTTLLVTSATPEDEKSLTLANLAVTMAQGGRRTLLVDCDLHRPRQHTFFGLPAQPGLTELLLDPAATPQPAATPVENLYLIPAGTLPPNPADLFTSRRMETVITALKTSADFVLFDAPPILAVTDAALLASKLDGVLLVVTAGHTKRDHALRAKELLEKIHVPVVGTILTNASVDRSLSAY